MNVCFKGTCFFDLMWKFAAERLFKFKGETKS